ncbi:MAG: nucleotidyl transferase AbiEii/AbiGii toxin family protein [bacterium]|nr:nucleotidyl transferase AbiEii/AbiGii toxin family protein [bacterium]
MNLFDQLVALAVKSRSGIAPLQAVVEKELLHHDILREMSEVGLLTHLTFIGGTCLRACYGSSRLSEDLDFSGGAHFNCGALGTLDSVLADRLFGKYGLHVEVSRPAQEKRGDVDTWKLKIVTRPDNRGLPVQRINIDICAVPSHDRRPVMLRNHYGVDMGTSGLIIQAQSREEILADKMVALALRPNRIKNRDLWDIAWLKQQGVSLPFELVPLKILDHRRSADEFADLLRERREQLRTVPQLYTAFVQEMRRFLPTTLVEQTVEQKAFWEYLTDLVYSECEGVLDSLAGTDKSITFKM